MAENDDQIGFNPTRDYVIPGRLLKQLFETTQPQPQVTALDMFFDTLTEMGVPYHWEPQSCEEYNFTHVWFSVPGGWELVFMFDSQNGSFIEMHLEG